MEVTDEAGPLPLAIFVQAPASPYSSGIETNNFWTGMTVSGTRIFTQQGCNSDYTAGSRRGIKLYGSGGDNINSTNFHYLVLGAN